MSQNVWDWQRPLDIVWSSTLLTAGSAKAGCPGPCPVRSWIAPLGKTSQPLWTICSSTWPHTGKKCGVQIEFCVVYHISIVSCPVNEQCLSFSPSHQMLTDTDELPCPESSPLRLQSHSSLSVFSLEKCISALILLALCWTHSSRSLPVLVWVTRSEHSRWDLISAEWRGACCPPGLSGASLQSCFPACQAQPIPGTWGFSSPAAGLGFSPHWPLWNPSLTREVPAQGCPAGAWLQLGFVPLLSLLGRVFQPAFNHLSNPNSTSSSVTLSKTFLIC